MQNHPTGPDEERPPQLNVVAALLRLGVIGIVSLLATAAIAHAGGWLHASKPAPVRVVDGLAQERGLQQAGFRLKNVKGPCLADVIEGDGRGPRDSRAGLFDPATGGFALAGGRAYLPGTLPTMRGMALRFMPVGDEDSPLTGETGETGEEGRDRVAAPVSLLPPAGGRSLN